MGKSEARPDIRGLFDDTIAASLCRTVNFLLSCCWTTWEKNITLRAYEFTCSHLKCAFIMSCKVP